MRTSFWIAATLASLALTPTANSQATKDAGIPVGTRIPEFEAIDQTGTRTRLGSIAGPKGAVLVFYRSADW